MSEQQEFRERFERIERLVEQLDAASDPAIRAAAQQLVQTLLDLHAMGLERLIAIIGHAGEPAAAIMASCARDPQVGSLLLLHSLHPVSMEERVAQALEKVRPYLRSHGGDVELLQVTDGHVQLRFLGTGHGCGESPATLRSAIEDAVYEVAPDLAALEVEGVTDQASPVVGFVKLEALRAAIAPQPSAREAGGGAPAHAMPRSG